MRKHTHENIDPERSGTRLILAQRFGNMYKLKFIRYTETQVMIRIYHIDKHQYDYLTAYYGNLINHRRVFSEYIITSKRQYTRLWASVHRGYTNIIAVYPNNKECKLTGSINKYKKLAVEPVRWHPEYDADENRWLVTSFNIKGVI